MSTDPGEQAPPVRGGQWTYAEVAAHLGIVRGAVRAYAPALATAAAVVGAGALWCAARWTLLGRRAHVLALAGVLLGGWVGAVIAIPLRPYTSDPQPRVVHWVPFTAGTEPIELAANVALFIPLGVALALTLPGGRGLLRRAVAIGAGCSTLIELAQLAQAGGRITETTDVLTNTAGTVVGALLTAAALGRPATGGRRPRTRPAAGQDRRRPH